MLSSDEITEIFYLTDEFSKEFERTLSKHQLRDDNGKRHRNKPKRLSESEVMTIRVAFHLSGMRCLKHYYLFYVCEHLHPSFPNLVSCNRFVELQQQVLLPLVVFLKSCRLGQTTAAGINFIDSTSLKVRHIKREHSKSKVFDGDDRYPLSIDSFIRNVSGKLYGDRGYISKKPADILFVDGIHSAY